MSRWPAWVLRTDVRVPMLACRAFCIQKGDRSDIVFGPVGMMIINFGKFCDSGAEEDSSDSDSSAVVCYEARHPCFYWYSSRRPPTHRGAHKGVAPAGQSPIPLCCKMSSNERVITPGISQTCDIRFILMNAGHREEQPLSNRPWYAAMQRLCEIVNAWQTVRSNYTIQPISHL